MLPSDERVQSPFAGRIETEQRTPSMEPRLSMLRSSIKSAEVSTEPIIGNDVARLSRSQAGKAGDLGVKESSSERDRSLLKSGPEHHLKTNSTLLLVLRHARRALVSSGQNCSAGSLFSPSLTSQCDASPLPPDLKTAELLPSTASASTFKVHSLPLGRLPSSRCIRSARSCNCELL